NFEVLVDYAHNVGGLKAIGGFMEDLDVSRKIGIIAGVGDRRTQDFYEIGRVAGEIFDEIIIRLDSDLRGKSADEITLPMMRGIEEVAPHKVVKVIPEEMRAIAHALENAEEGAFVAI